MNDQIRSFLRLLEEKAPGGAAHAQRVAVMAVATGHAMGLSDEDLIAVHAAATLHEMEKHLEIAPERHKPSPQLHERIIAVAELFDKTAYGQADRKGSGEEEALRLVKSESGKGLDPEVVRAFLRIQHLIQPLI